MVYEDQLNRRLKLPGIPKRIISLVPSQTELLVDLGLSDHIVGITKFCVHPDSIRREKKNVGGTKNVHYDRIRELSPEIILCNKEENTKEIVETLEKEYPVHVSDIFTIEDSLEMIQQYGKILGCIKESEIIASRIKSELNSFLDFIKDKPQKRVAYFIWRKPWMTVGTNTFIDHLLKINGFINVFGAQERYPEISEDELSTIKDIDLILLSSEPFPFAEKHIEEINDINPDVKTILVDGEYFSWYGSRLTAAFNYFKTLH
ncbi:helical backbone metal receptor [Aquimarina sp. 2201CG5-10]|uniref:helical backbone metal receptor n=1 Tax=Aquimarina callyspongiae TaxID=3098150 RepID=UPI002AB3D9A6|nr:helical backbone metal receptor [Aquimarina sp. 2201CG5-10]MDY8134161.1 helical backbone metal receptor [Aquimarina sp. 2201CG5-10]